jgi:hypothetical protein
MTRICGKSNSHELASPLVLDKSVAHKAVDVLDRIVSHQVVRRTNNMPFLTRFLFVLLSLTAFNPGRAQEARILSLQRDGTLTWTNSVTSAYCGVEYSTDLPGGWLRAPSSLWNIPVTDHVMSVRVPLEQIQLPRLFLRIRYSPNRLPGIPGSETYDIDSAGIPRFVAIDYIESGKIVEISRFRSGEGHDYSDDFESCRSMKHYFLPSNSVDWGSIQIRSPVAGEVTSLEQEQLGVGGTQVRIKSTDFPAFYFILFHVQTNGQIAVGNFVSAGQLLGTHVGTQTTSDIAVGVNTPTGWKLISYFNVMTDALFATYQSRGVTARNDLIISKQARDADPLTCDGETFQSPGNLLGWLTIQ